MGASLSRQEELFVTLQWPLLLETAMHVDSLADTVDDDNNSSRGNRDAGGGNLDRNHRAALSGFRLSFREWQAFLSLLENDVPSSVPLQLYAGIPLEKINSPLVFLAVHVCTWCDGCLGDAALREKLHALPEILTAVTENSPGQTGGNRRRGKESKSFAVNETVLVDDLYSLLEPLLSPGAGSLPVPQLSKYRRTFERVLNTEMDRPALQVALCLLCAVLASRASSPEFAEEGIKQLQGLKTAMSHQQDRRGTHHLPGATLTDRWRIIWRLEEQLIARQREQDVVECMSAKGRSLETLLCDIRRSRLAVDDAPLASMTPAARWDYCVSQYVGQRHIWEKLRAHYLTADVFEVEKATVMVFFGPSGYGKSELAKRVASAIHGMPVSELEQSGKLVYIHMPSFCTKDSIYSLVDPPVAHVGEGILLSALNKHNDAVVVLDEFEKSTADAIQHLWLSAFQKNGTLRSLKDPARSVSTVRTTFILTCNLISNVIESRATTYLSASGSEQVHIRSQLEALCRERCREDMKDPFVNRVDYFFPFVPYTVKERQEFVAMQLESFLTGQEAKGRVVHVTPRCIDAMVSRLHTFHASTVEEILRPLIVEMAENKWVSAVLTVVRDVASGEGERFVLLPVHNTGGRRRRSTDTNLDGAAWEDLPDGNACIDLWRNIRSTAENNVRERNSKPNSVNRVAEMATSPPSSSQRQPDVRIDPTKSPARRRQFAQPGGACDAVLVKETVLEKHFEKRTARELDLEKEIVSLKAKLLDKEKEVHYLKQKVLLLEKALAVLLCTVVCCLFVLATVIGMKLTLLLCFLVAVLLFVILKIPLSLVFHALRILYGALGPVKSAIVCALASIWLYLSIARRVSCTK